jgi:hypothetical protein
MAAAGGAKVLVSACRGARPALHSRCFSCRQRANAGVRQAHTCVPPPPCSAKCPIQFCFPGMSSSKNCAKHSFMQFVGLWTLSSGCSQVFSRIIYTKPTHVPHLFSTTPSFLLFDGSLKSGASSRKPETRPPQILPTGKSKTENEVRVPESICTSKINKTRVYA